jgi:hypothetical protein
MTAIVTSSTPIIKVNALPGVARVEEVSDGSPAMRLAS